MPALVVTSASLAGVGFFRKPFLAPSGWKVFISSGGESGTVTTCVMVVVVVEERLVGTSARAVEGPRG